MQNQKLKLILASRSPRRLEILRSMGFLCTPTPSNSSESFDENLNLEANLRTVSERKVKTVYARLSARNHKSILILGADTVVVVGRHVLGKPKNLSHARQMLRLLSGKNA